MDKKSEIITLEYNPGETNFYLYVPFSQKEEVKSIGGIWTQSKKAWKFALDVNIWKKIKETFGGRGTLMVPRAFIKQIEKVEDSQNEFLKFKKLAEENAPIDFSVNGVSLYGKNPLFNYQKWGIRCGLLVGDGFLIGDVPGLGKSIQSIGLALERKNQGLIKNCLVVCPASLKYNWHDEIRKFTGENLLVIDGSAEERRKKWMAQGYFFKITNYETLVRDVFINKAKPNEYSAEEQNFRSWIQNSFDMIAVDEIHSIKHHNSQRTLALKQFKAKYKLGLSGTPVDGRLEELHSIFEFLKPGLFESKGRFMRKHAILNCYGQVKAYINVQEVRDRIEPYYIRRLKENVLKDLPDKLYKDVYVELGKKEFKLYQDLIYGASKITKEDEAITRILRTRQFLDFPELVGLHNPSDKFQALSELLEELIIGNGEKVLIFTQYKQALDQIVFNLKDKYNILQIHGDVTPKERIEIVNKFNNCKEYNILIGTDAMSTGLNIGSANAVINYEDNFSPAIMQQREDRAHRATTKHNVTVYRFICKNTFEENVRRALGNKMSLNNAVLDEDCSTFEIKNMTSVDLLKYL